MQDSHCLSVRAPRRPSDTPLIFLQLILKILSPIQNFTDNTDCRINVKAIIHSFYCKQYLLSSIFPVLSPRKAMTKLGVGKLV